MRAVALALLLCACGDKKSAPAPRRASGEATTQVRFSNGSAVATEEGSLGFTITKIHTGQTPVDTAPFFAAGGDWTFVEAHLDGDPAATFAFGMPPLATKDGPGFADMVFLPTTRDAGTRVIAALAKALAVDAPAPATGMLQPLKMPIAVLGHGQGRLDNGYGGTGTWDTTKLFCSAGDVEAAELFFNVSLADKRGVFAEKDTDYNRDIVACLAIALRDGDLPPRTVANDPTLAAKPIALVRGAQLSKHRAEEVSLRPRRVLLAEERGDAAALLEVDLRTGATKELYKTTERIEWGRCDEAVARCLLKLSVPATDRNTFGGADRQHLAVFENGKVTPLDIPGVERPSLPVAPFSPDGLYVAVETSEALVVYDRTRKQARSLAKGAFLSLDLVAWERRAGHWVAIVTKLKDTEDEPSTVVAWQVDADGPAVPDKPLPPVANWPMSPDGTRRVDFGDGKVVVTVNGKPATLALHPKDARHAKPDCCFWIDNRIVWMTDGFLDTDTMKVSPRVEDDRAIRIAYVRGTRAAILIGDTGTWLAKLVIP